MFSSPFGPTVWIFGITLAAILCSPRSALATGPLLPSCDSSAVVVDTSITSMPIGLLWGEVSDESKAHWKKIIALLPLGDTAVAIDPASISFSGPCAGLDTVATWRIMDLIAQRSVISAIQSLVISSSNLCTGPFLSKVYIPDCVIRSGSQANTEFSAVDECEQTTRSVSHCGSSGTVTASVVATDGCGSCSSGESVCASGGGLE